MEGKRCRPDLVIFTPNSRQRPGTCVGCSRLTQPIIYSSCSLALLKKLPIAAQLVEHVLPAVLQL